LSWSRSTKVAYVAVGATVTVVTASLIGAFCWVVFHDGFGMGDLLALALWSLPFGAVIGTACVVLRSAERPGRRALRVLVATAMGALFGLLWTLLMVRMMGPWFGTFSFPVLPILATSGALTLGLFVYCVPESRVVLSLRGEPRDPGR
jgi:hypothetical protein